MMGAPGYEFGRTWRAQMIREKRVFWSGVVAGCVGSFWIVFAGAALWWVLA